MARIARMVFNSLTLFLGMFFFFFGMIKVSRFLNVDTHREMRKNFVRYAKVLPLFATHLEWKISPRIYRLTVGYLEIITGLLLAFCPGQLKQIVNVILILLSIGAIYTHVSVGDDYNTMIPAMAFCSMLTTRLILYFLLKRMNISIEQRNENLKPTRKPGKAKTENFGEKSKSGLESLSKWWSINWFNQFFYSQKQTSTEQNKENEKGVTQAVHDVLDVKKISQSKHSKQSNNLPKKFTKSTASNQKRQPRQNRRKPKNE